MEHPYSLVAPQLLSRRARLSRALAVSVVCVALVVLVCGYHAYAPLSAPTSLLLRDGIPTDREIEFESAVAQRQGAKAALKPVPPKVLSIFEQAVNEQKHDLDAQPLEDGESDSTLNMHRTAEGKVMELACKLTPQSPKCKEIAAAKAAKAAAAESAKAEAKKQAAAASAAAQAKVIADAKAAAAGQAKAIADAVAKATAAADAKLKAAAEEVAKTKKEAADEVKAAKADTEKKIKAAVEKAEAAQKTAASSKAKK